MCRPDGYGTYANSCRTRVARAPTVDIKPRMTSVSGQPSHLEQSADSSQHGVHLCLKWTPCKSRVRRGDATPLNLRLGCWLRATSPAPRSPPLRAHELSANLVHKWRRGVAPMTLPPALSGADHVAGEFIALALPSREAVPTARADIRIELRRGATSVAVSWPLAAADQCAAWLGRWLR